MKRERRRGKEKFIFPRFSSLFLFLFSEFNQYPNEINFYFLLSFINGIQFLRPNPMERPLQRYRPERLGQTQRQRRIQNCRQSHRWYFSTQYPKYLSLYRRIVWRLCFGTGSKSRSWDSTPVFKSAASAIPPS